MRILALDTATRIASVAVVDGDRQLDRVVAEAHHVADHGTAGLLTAIDRVCRDSATATRDIAAIALGSGPGSFTGLRIGMATAKGIAFAAGIPLWLVSSLAALADGVAASGVVVAALDARRGELFAGCFVGGVAIAREAVIAPDAFADWVATAVGDRPIAAFTGDALAAFPQLAPFGDRWHPATPAARSVARLALAGSRADSLMTGVPTYIRASEAEIMYPDGVPGALRRG